MTRRAPDGLVLFIAIVALVTAAFLAMVIGAFTTQTPASGVSASAPPLAGPTSREGSASRGNPRTAPPSPRVVAVRATHSPEPDQGAASQAESTTPSVAPSGKSGPGSGDLPPLLLLIRDHESGGDYTAYNPTGCEGYGCGGAYQLHARYAAGWAAEAGYPGMSSAAQTWPREVQDAVALFKFNQTGGDLWCAWTQYC